MASGPSAPKRPDMSKLEYFFIDSLNILGSVTTAYKARIRLTKSISDAVSRILDANVVSTLSDASQLGLGALPGGL